MDAYYIAGPMSRIEAYNFPAFFEVEEAMQASPIFPGDFVNIFNPARHDCERHGLMEILEKEGPKAAGQWLLDHPQDFSMRRAMKDDLTWIADYATAIVLLPGWENSSGANAEVALAKTLGLRIYLALKTERWGRGLRKGDDWLAERTWTFDLLLERDIPPLQASVLPFEPPPSFNTVSAISFADDEPPLAFMPPDKVLLADLDDIAEELTEDRVAREAEERFGEVRLTSETGGQKGVKMARFDLLPWGALTEVAEHFGRGAAKYADHNWRRGYPWSRSYGAAQRHFAGWVTGEDYDICTGHEVDCKHTDAEGKPFVAAPSPNGPTCFNHTGSHHLAAFAWHALVLLEFKDTHPKYDDRWLPGREGNLDRFESVETA
jgi:hypothetical protein